MKREQKEIQGISAYVTDKELTANKYVLQCFTVSIVIYIIAFILNLLNVFIINKTVMFNGFVASLTTYVVVLIVTRIISLSDEKAKYFILFASYSDVKIWFVQNRKSCTFCRVLCRFQAYS